MINAAIVGLGWWGKTLVESAGNSDAIRFVAGATRTATPELETFAKKHGFRLLPNYEAVLAERDVAAVRKAGVTLALGYNRRLHPEMHKLREMIRAGQLGTVLHLEATMTFPNVLFINPTHWRADKSETPCGGLMPMGVHAIDGMIDLCGPIDHVFAQSFRRAATIDADDTTSILLRMKEGMSGYLGTMTTTGPGFSFQVFGSKGGLRLEGVTHVAGASSDERRTRLFGTCKFQPVKGEAKTWQAASLDISRAALEAFAKAAAGGPAFPIPYDQMIHGVAVTEAIVRSASSGKVEQVMQI